MYKPISTPFSIVREYYEAFGLRRLALRVLERSGFIFRRKLLFFEVALDGLSGSPRAIDDPALDFVQVELEELRDAGFPDDPGWITTAEAQRRLMERECALFALRHGNEIVCYEWIEFGKAHIPFLELVLTLPQGTGYALAQYTVPEHRGKGFLSRLNLRVLDHLKERGYDRVFLGIEPENHSSLRANSKSGYEAWRSVLYYRFLPIRYYHWKDQERSRRILLWRRKVLDWESWIQSQES